MGVTVSVGVVVAVAVGSDDSTSIEVDLVLEVVWEREVEEMAVAAVSDFVLAIASTSALVTGVEPAAAEEGDMTEARLGPLMLLLDEAVVPEGEAGPGGFVGDVGMLSSLA